MSELLTGEGRPYAAPTRNMHGIAYEALRARVDARFNELHDTLSAAYYDHWRHGEHQPWHGYDVLPAREASKQQFDKLHGLVFHLYEIALDDANSAEAEPDARLARTMHTPNEKLDGLTRRQRCQVAVAALKQEGIDIEL